MDCYRYPISSISSNFLLDETLPCAASVAFAPLHFIPVGLSVPAILLPVSPVV